MRIAVLADIHANLPALEAVLADLAGRHVDRVINLGDCVSGPLWPRETLALLRAQDWPTVRGNHDRWVGQDPHATLSRTDAFTAEQLDEAERDWLAGLPTHLPVGSGGLAFHACPTDDNAYLLEDIVDGRLVPARHGSVAGRLGEVRAPLILCAHSHLAGVMRLPDGRWIVNPGSVGCPAYDDPTSPAHVSESGSPAARYAIVETAGDPASKGPVVELLALAYDHDGASRRAAALGRTDWAAALSTGFIVR